jgi:transcriptional regulator with XRE-family HTH domain
MRHYFSQNQLALRAGLSPGLVQSLEQGRRTDPRLSTLMKLAAALEVTLDELVTGSSGVCST